MPRFLLALLCELSQRMEHFGFFGFCAGLGLMTALQVLSVLSLEYRVLNTHLIASSNTLFRFRCVSAEHSRYFTALISFATCTACSYWMGAIFLCRSCSRTSGSSLRSSLVPTSMMGTPGAWCSISGYHCIVDQSTVACRDHCIVDTFALTLSNDDGLTIEKQIKNTSVCGYDRGRSRS